MQPIIVDIDPPDEGHFYAFGPLPRDTPDVVMGPRGIRAYRVLDCGAHSSLFALESFAEYIPADGRVPLVALPPETPVPGYFVHPAVAQKDDKSIGFDEIVGALQLDGRPATPRIVHENAGEGSRIVQRFRVEWETDTAWAVVWAWVMARSPTVQCSAAIIRKDRRAEPVEFRFEFGEEVELPPSCAWPTVDAGGRVLEGLAQLERGGVFLFRFAIHCRTGLDDMLTAQANEANAGGFRWFMPTTWPAGSWQGVSPRFGTELGRDELFHALDRLETAHTRQPDGYGPRPFGPAANSNQGGAHDGLGVAWWIPLFQPAAMQPQEVHLWAAQDAAARPVHLLEPGTSYPIRPETILAVDATAERQIFARTSLDDQVVPKFATKGAIPVVLDNGATDFRTATDEQHLADAMLVATYCATGDPGLRWVIESHRALDLAQRRVVAGWSNLSRGDARTITSMLLADRATRGAADPAVVDHCLRRFRTFLGHTPGPADPEAPVRPGRAQTDGRLSCESPAFVVYEEALLAWACWQLAESTDGDDRVDALFAAARFGVAVASSLYFDPATGRWSAPYAMTHFPSGESLPMADRAPTSRYVHPTEWGLEWAGAGLRAAVFAAREIDETIGGAPVSWWEEHLANARLAVAQLDAVERPTLDRAHSAAWGLDLPPVEA